MWRDVYGFNLCTEDDETCVEPVGCGLGNLPVFFSGPSHINFDSVTGAQRAATAASDVLSK